MKEHRKLKVLHRNTIMKQSNANDSKLLRAVKFLPVIAVQ